MSRAHHVTRDFSELGDSAIPTAGRSPSMAPSQPRLTPLIPFRSFHRQYLDYSIAPWRIHQLSLPRSLCTPTMC